MKLNLWIGTSFPVYKSYTLTWEVFFCCRILFVLMFYLPTNEKHSTTFYSPSYHRWLLPWVSPNYKYNSYLLPCFIQQILKSCKYNSQPKNVKAAISVVSGKTGDSLLMAVIASRKRNNNNIGVCRQQEYHHQNKRMDEQQRVQNCQQKNRLQN